MSCQDDSDISAEINDPTISHTDDTTMCEVCEAGNLGQQILRDRLRPEGIRSEPAAIITREACRRRFGHSYFKPLMKIFSGAGCYSGASEQIPFENNDASEDLLPPAPPPPLPPPSSSSSPSSPSSSSSSSPCRDLTSPRRRSLLPPRKRSVDV